MASITTRAGKGSPLTNAEVDANFTNLNAELLTKQDALGFTPANKAGDTFTGDVVINTKLAVGAAITANTNYRFGKGITGGTSSSAFVQNGNVQSDVVTTAVSFNSQANTAAAAFTLTNYFHYYAQQGVVGAGSSITAITGFYADNTLAGANSTYGFRGAVSSGSGKWNLYMDGTASNYLAGATIFNNAIGLGSAGSPSYGTAGQVLTSAGAGAAPTWATVSGALTFTGDVTGTGSTGSSTSLTLANSGVTAGVYGANAVIPSITVDAKGRVTNAAGVTPSGTWGISISGNAATATSATNSDTLDGFHASAFINTTNGAGNYIVSDTRSTATPTDIGDSGVKWDFKANGTDGLSPGHYWVAQTVQAWGDASGGYINQLAFTGNSMYRRNASIGGTWGSWLTLLDSGNYTSYRGTQLVSPNGATVVAADSAMPDAGHSFIHTLGLGPSGNDGHILGMTWAGTTSIYGAQIWVDTDPNNRMAFRSRSSTGVWTGWNEVIHSSNYNNYALPLSGGTLTGRTVVNINGRTTGYTGSNLEVYTGDNTPPGISFHRGGYSATLLYEIDGELYINAWTTRAQSGKLLSSGNYTSYVTPAQYLGTAATKAIAYNANSISENITIANGQNAYSCGPITINDGYTITVQDGGVWTVI